MPLLVVTALLAGTPFAAPPEVQQLSTLALSNTASNTPVSLSKSDVPEPEVVEERLNTNTLGAKVGTVFERLSSPFRPDPDVRKVRDILDDSASVWNAFNKIYEKSTDIEDITAKLTALATAEKSIDYKVFEAARKAVKAARKAVKAAEKDVRRVEKVLAGLAKKQVKKPFRKSATAGYEKLAITDELHSEPLADLEKKKGTLADAESKVAEIEKKLVDSKMARLELKRAVSDFFDGAVFKTWYAHAIKATHDGQVNNSVYDFLVQKFDKDPWVVAAMIDLMWRKWGTAGKIAKQLEKAQFSTWLKSGDYSNYPYSRGRFMGP
uniref:RxLR effector candidate protein n=1 Tax=Hyaloperonospora arabidopsidis (strain Emoy2) TaxID=559515 RepID=M4BSJ3_HYAAE